MGFLLTGCGKSHGKLTQTYVGEPYSDWGQSPTGSAKYLDGDTVLVSVFLEDTASGWSSTDRKLVRKNLEIACDYLEEQGEEYNKEVNLIYDFDENPDLEYHMKYDKPFPKSIDISDEEYMDGANELLYATNDFLKENVPVKQIMEQYNVNSIGFLIFIDNEASSAVTYPYYKEESEYWYYEMCFIPLRWNNGTGNINPDTYAHEILHLFGAKDLYMTSSNNGFSKSFVKYVYEEYPKDIMLGYSSQVVSMKKKIKEEITDITAYFLGWKKSIKEISQYPDIAYDIPAIYYDKNCLGSEYDEYMLPARKVVQNSHYTLRMVENGICILIVLAIIVNFIRTDIRKRKEPSGYEVKVLDVDDIDYWDGNNNPSGNNGYYGSDNNPSDSEDEKYR